MRSRNRPAALRVEPSSDGKRPSAPSRTRRTSRRSEPGARAEGYGQDRRRGRGTGMIGTTGVRERYALRRFGGLHDYNCTTHPAPGRQPAAQIPQCPATPGARDLLRGPSRARERIGRGRPGARDRLPHMDRGGGTPALTVFSVLPGTQDLAGSAPRTELAPDVITNSWACPHSRGDRIERTSPVVETRGRRIFVDVGGKRGACYTVDFRRPLRRGLSSGRRRSKTRCDLFSRVGHRGRSGASAGIVARASACEQRLRLPYRASRERPRRSPTSRAPRRFSSGRTAYGEIT